MKGFGQKSIPGEDGDGFPENLVVGRLSPPEVVVVHGGEVVVDQGIGMDELESAGHGEGLSRPAPDGVGGSENQDRAESFPSRKEAVSHGPVNLRRGFILGRDPAGERLVDQALLPLQVFLQAEISPHLLPG